MKSEHWALRMDRTDSWETPRGLFDALDKVFAFELDVCAQPENAKCKRYFTPEQDGLRQEWVGRCWMNPPYGRGIDKWVRKAYESALSGKALVVCLLPSKTDTAWWHNFVAKGFVHFIRGRIKFGAAKHNAPFGCALVIFWPKPDEGPVSCQN